MDTKTAPARTTARRLADLADAIASMPTPTGRPRVIATDGSRVPSCDGDVGGWAYAAELNGDTCTRRGMVAPQQTPAGRPVTSSRMELHAVYEALCAYRHEPWVQLLVDSRSTVSVLRQLEDYCRDGLRASSGRQLADADLLEQIACEIATVPTRAVHVTWVKAHASTQLNLAVDRAARSCARRAARRIERAGRARRRTPLAAAA